MNCYYCEQKLTSDNVKYDIWGRRKVIAHRTCGRLALLNRAYEMGLFCAAEEHTDTEIVDAIAAEKISGEVLDRIERNHEV